MKAKTIYQCEYCLSEYTSKKDAVECEAKCLHLTVDEYYEYMDLLWRERVASNIVYRQKNEKNEKLFDDFIKDVLEFQKKHGIIEG